MTRPAALSLLAVTPLTLLTACAEKGGDGGTSGAISVRAADDACELSRTSAPTGSIAFKITNEGSKITEFYLYSPDKKVVSEVEGIGPGISRTMKVKVTKAGSYTTACKPGMVGDGIRGGFSVTDK
ncbi:cupredoxin domain-containing protein [Streptomyces sp. 205]|uniref:Cupredoxin domain-containing protein n=1 Tax=Streptomyces coffeae TaxID=621382 RepID=A0ABS1NLL5_9ACTN|nr:cupredoxin domain-containing protein [Streptomyces coffeae]